MDITDIISGLVTIAAATQLNDGFYPRVRNLNDTPISLEQGDCPQVFFHPQRDSTQRITFSAPDGSHQARRPFVVLAYYIDQAENLGAIWESRPRTAKWCSAFVKAVGLNDALGLQNTYCEASSEVRDGLRYNGIPFRGGVVSVTGFFFE